MLYAKVRESWSIEEGPLNEDPCRCYGLNPSQKIVNCHSWDFLIFRHVRIDRLAPGQEVAQLSMPTIALVSVSLFGAAYALLYLALLTIIRFRQDR